MKKCHWWK